VSGSKPDLPDLIQLAMCCPVVMTRPDGENAQFNADYEIAGVWTYPASAHRAVLMLSRW
jgi:hypothetical protein